MPLSMSTKAGDHQPQARPSAISYLHVLLADDHPLDPLLDLVVQVDLVLDIEPVVLQEAPEDEDRGDVPEGSTWRSAPRSSGTWRT